MTPSIDPAARELRMSKTAEERLAAQIDARVADRLPKLLGYATPERARYCPSSLRQPYGSGAWMPISEAERAKVIEANLRAQILAELRPHLVQDEAPTAPVEATPLPFSGDPLPVRRGMYRRVWQLPPRHLRPPGPGLVRRRARPRRGPA